MSFNSVDEYIAAQPKAAQAVLHRVRRAIRAAVPDAQETISYNMPTFKLSGKNVLHFAGWKNHYSIYPANSRVVAAFDDLAAYTIEKNTLQLSYEESVPVRLIARIAKFRAEEVSGHRVTRSITRGRRRER